MKLPGNATMPQLQAISSAVKNYYYQAPLQFLPSREDFAGWLATLPETERELYATRGMMRCGHIMSFKRFYFEKYGYSLTDYLKNALTSEEFALWLSLYF